MGGLEPPNIFLEGAEPPQYFRPGSCNFELLPKVLKGFVLCQPPQYLCLSYTYDLVLDDRYIICATFQHFEIELFGHVNYRIFTLHMCTVTKVECHTCKLGWVVSPFPAPFTRRNVIVILHGTTYSYKFHANTNSMQLLGHLNYRITIIMCVRELQKVSNKCAMPHMQVRVVRKSLSGPFYKTECDFHFTWHHKFLQVSRQYQQYAVAWSPKLQNYNHHVCM